MFNLKSKLIAFETGLVALLVLFYKVFKAGGDRQKVKNLKKEAKANEKTNEMLSVANSGRANSDRVLNKSRNLGKRPSSNN